MTDNLITRLYGERCADHDDNCCVCVVWDMRDRIEALSAEVERLRDALLAVDEMFSYPKRINSRTVMQKVRAALGDTQ